MTKKETKENELPEWWYDIYVKERETKEKEKKKESQKLTAMFGSVMWIIFAGAITLMENKLWLKIIAVTASALIGGILMFIHGKLSDKDEY